MQGNFKETLHKGNSVSVILMDLSKVFDTLNYNLIIAKFETTLNYNLIIAKFETVFLLSLFLTHIAL